MGACVARRGRATRIVLTKSDATMMCFGLTRSRQWASDAPTKLVLRRATTPPARVMSTQIAMYSGLFAIIKQTVSPFRIRWVSAQRA
jgi:hypothetical protein